MAEEPVAPPQSTATPAPVAVATTPAPVVAEATPAPPRLAPEGIFFLLKKVSVTTTDSIIGLKPGTTVTRQPDGTYRDAEGNTLTLTADQITNDLDIAAQVTSADATSQAAFRQLAQQRNQAHQAAQAAAAATPAPTSTNRTVVVVSPPQAPTPRPNSLSTGNSALGAAHTRIKDGYIWEKSASGQWFRVRRVGQ